MLEKMLSKVVLKIIKKAILIGNQNKHDWLYNSIHEDNGMIVSHFSHEYHTEENRKDIQALQGRIHELDKKLDRLLIYLKVEEILRFQAQKDE